VVSPLISAPNIAQNYAKYRAALHYSQPERLMRCAAHYAAKALGGWMPNRQND